MKENEKVREKGRANEVEKTRTWEQTYPVELRDKCWEKMCQADQY